MLRSTYASQASKMAVHIGDPPPQFPKLTGDPATRQWVKASVPQMVLMGKVLTDSRGVSWKLAQHKLRSSVLRISWGRPTAMAFAHSVKRLKQPIVWNKSGHPKKV